MSSFWAIKWVVFLTTFFNNFLKNQYSFIELELKFYLLLGIYFYIFFSSFSYLKCLQCNSQYKRDIIFFNEIVDISDEIANISTKRAYEMKLGTLDFIFRYQRSTLQCPRKSVSRRVRTLLISLTLSLTPCMIFA